MAWAAKAGGLAVRYKDANGRIWPARIISKGTGTALNLKVGGQTVSNAAKLASRTTVGVGWFHAGR